MRPSIRSAHLVCVPGRQTVTRGAGDASPISSVSSPAHFTSRTISPAAYETPGTICVAGRAERDLHERVCKIVDARGRRSSAGALVETQPRSLPIAAAEAGWLRGGRRARPDAVADRAGVPRRRRRARRCRHRRGAHRQSRRRARWRRRAPDRRSSEERNAAHAALRSRGQIQIERKAAHHQRRGDQLPGLQRLVHHQREVLIPNTGTSNAKGETVAAGHSAPARSPSWHSLEHVVLPISRRLVKHGGQVTQSAQGGGRISIGRQTFGQDGQRQQRRHREHTGPHDIGEHVDRAGPRALATRLQAPGSHRGRQQGEPDAEQSVTFTAAGGR